MNSNTLLKVVGQMTEHAEIAAFLQVKICHSETETNAWLQENADVEIVEIKFSGTKKNSVVLIIYRID